MIQCSERERRERERLLLFKSCALDYTSLYFHGKTLSKQCWKLLLRVAKPTFANTFIISLLIGTAS